MDQIIIIAPLPEEQDELALLARDEPSINPLNSIRAQPYTIDKAAEGAFRKTVDVLLVELARHKGKTWKGEPLRHRRNALRFVLLNLFVAWRRFDAETEARTKYTRPCVAYSRSKDNYRLDRMLKGYHLRYESMMDIADGLAALGYIDHVPGMYDRRVGGRGFMSRMRATPRLIEALISSQLDRSRIEVQPPCLIVMRSKDEDGNDITIDNSQHTTARSLEPAVRRINEMLENANVRLSITREERAEMMMHIARKNQARKRDELFLGMMPNVRHNKVHRVFNDNNYAHGGRFYGHWVQNIPGDLRKKGCITMNGSPTVERDYSAYHIRMLYRSLVPPRSAPNGDPYALDGWPEEPYRKFIKLFVMTLINAETELSAIQAVWLRDGGERAPAEKYGLSYNDVKAICAAIKEKHQALSGLWCSPRIGVRLQYQDSRIAQAVMLKLWVEYGIPSVPMHDSFIVAEEHEGHLAIAMSTESEKELGEAMPHDTKRGPLRPGESSVWVPA